MLISHRHRFVFLKTRKTAGTSVEMALQPFCLPDAAPPVPEWTQAIVSDEGIVGSRIAAPERSEESRRWFNHMGATQIAQQMGHALFEDYLKVATVRDPFERTVSLFHWMARNDPAAAMSWPERRSRFRDWVLGGRWHDDREITHHDGVYCVELAIRYENLTEDLDRAAERIGLDDDRIVLSHSKNMKSARQGVPTPDYFDPDTIGEVRRRMDWVFDRFAYPDRPGETVPGPAPRAASAATGLAQ